MKSFIATLAVVATLGAVPAFAMDAEVNANARNEIVATARGEVAAPAQRASQLRIETSAQYAAPASAVDNAR